jgi:hypothetical protein
MPKDWSRRTVKDKSTGATVARISYIPINRQKYEAFKQRVNAPRANGRFGSRVSRHAGTNQLLSAAVSGVLRKRRAGARRDDLSGVGVINTGFAPVVNNKSHLHPDTFGGPSTDDNLINEERSINLGAHKVVENRINSFGEAAFPGSGPLKRRGSMVVEDVFGANEESTTRTYVVHTDGGNGVAERFDQFTVRRV